MPRERGRAGGVDSALWDRLDTVGREFRPTATIELPHPRVKLFAKLESANPTGSAKDRSAYWILREAIRRGEVGSGTTVVESSSGNFALSLARFCRALGLAFVPVVDPNANRATVATLRRTCARVEEVDAADGSGGYLLTRLRRVSELLDEHADAYWPNQYSNLDAARAHYVLTGSELLESLPRIDYLFVGVGTGATIVGLSERVKEACPHAAVVAVDVEGSVIFGGPPKRRRIPGIGSSITPPLVEGAPIDDVLTVSEWEEAMGCRRLLGEHGVFAGGSTGAVYAAISRYFEDYDGPPPVVAFLCVDRGDPYRDTVYDPAWVAENLAPVTTSASTRPEVVGVQAS